MAALAFEQIERRRERRVAGGGSRWKPDAVLRPGLAVVLLNMSRRSALVESAAWLRPGACTELQLAGAEMKTSIKGRLDRCHVVALEPMRYQGVVLFEGYLELE